MQSIVIEIPQEVAFQLRLPLVLFSDNSLVATMSERWIFCDSECEKSCNWILIQKHRSKRLTLT